MASVPKRIQSIVRSAAILEIMAQQGGSARLGEIAAKAGMEKTTAHNILQTLDHLGYVQRRPGDMRYHLGGRILNLSRIMGDDHDLRTRIRPTLEAIARHSGATVHLGVPSGDEAAYLDRVDPHAAQGPATAVQRREAIEGSAVGLVFLAFVPGMGQRVLSTRAHALDGRVREQIEAVRLSGYALDLESYRPGQNAVAVPWREHGEVRAAIALTGPCADLPRARLMRLAWMMMTHVARATVQPC
ncbi:IclR family transcriptional regulator [Komagataeibacter xylinus]|uniref:IclR family transcriptional regulator n=1 Tax=Komagataeibacter xylinus TaxID=28448 RepID=UPI00280B991B|nr:IclR family transcriptional regulator [Komagataeibacter xylinus]